MYLGSEHGYYHHLHFPRFGRAATRGLVSIWSRFLVDAPRTGASPCELCRTRRRLPHCWTATIGLHVCRVQWLHLCLWSNVFWQNSQTDFGFVVEKNFLGFFIIINKFVTEPKCAQSMMGYPGHGRGVTPRLCEELFLRIDSAKESGRNTTFEVKLSFLEIYNERVQDLLSKKREDLKIVHDPQKGPTLSMWRNGEYFKIQHLNLHCFSSNLRS